MLALKYRERLHMVSRGYYLRAVINPKGLGFYSRDLPNNSELNPQLL